MRKVIQTDILYFSIWKIICYLTMIAVQKWKIDWQTLFSFLLLHHINFLHNFSSKLNIYASDQVQSEGCCLVTQLFLAVWDPMDCRLRGFPVLHCLLEFAQTPVRQVGDAIQPSYHLSSSPSPPALSLSQHQGLFQWVTSLHQVAKLLELHLQHQSFQWIFSFDFL